jgi:ABC-type Fe3+-siderophore transport system permease subunit
MAKLLKCDVLSIAFILSIIVFGTAVVVTTTINLTPRGKIVFLIIIIGSFFSSLSSILQLISKRKKVSNNDLTKQ